MKFTTTYTDIHGLTTSFSVSADASSLRQLFEDSELSLTAEYLESSFERCLPEMRRVHLEAHHEVCRNLLAASCESLKSEFGGDDHLSEPSKDEALLEQMLAVCRIDDETVEIFSCTNNESMCLPFKKIPVLISALTHLYRGSTTPEASAPCVSLTASECGETE